jgi:hypothetical protein
VSRKEYVPWLLCLLTLSFDTSLIVFFFFNLIALPPVLVPRHLPFDVSSDQPSSCSNSLPFDKPRDLTPTSDGDYYPSPPTVSVSQGSEVPGPVGKWGNFLRAAQEVMLEWACFRDSATDVQRVPWRGVAAFGCFWSFGWVSEYSLVGRRAVNFECWVKP